MAFIIFIGILIYYKTDVDLPRMLVCLPVSLLITCIATFGLGTLLAALNIKYKDFRYIIPFMIQAFLFVTPVIYPVSIISQNWIKYILACNPIYSAIELFRYSIIDKPLEPTLLMISIVSAIIFFFAGLFYFRKTEFYFADLA
jgi:lipopolysaccharide transport system permease protein